MDEVEDPLCPKRAKTLIKLLNVEFLESVHQFFLALLVQWSRARLDRDMLGTQRRSVLSHKKQLV